MEDAMSDEIEHLYWSDELEATDMEKPTQPFETWSPTTNWPKKPKKKGGSQRFLLPDCRHWRQKFELQDGLHVFASAWLDKPTRPRKPEKGVPDAQIDVGFYLDSRWASEKLLVSPGFRLSIGKRTRGPRAIVYPWEDWGVPEDPSLFRRVLAWLLERVEFGKSVEIGCMGGHGRTGTVLACLLVLQGIGPRRAIGQVRSAYCEEAIESRRQIELIDSLL